MDTLCHSCDLPRGAHGAAVLPCVQCRQPFHVDPTRLTYQSPRDGAVLDVRDCMTAHIAAEHSLEAWA